jgi:hypothetical protein
MDSLVPRRLVIVLGLLAALFTMSASSTARAAASPRWKLSTLAPDSVTAGRPVWIQVWVENVGSVPLTGTMTIEDTFPAGVTPTEPKAFHGTPVESSCAIVGQTSRCVLDVNGVVPGAEFNLPYLAQVEGGVTGTLVNRVTVSGGGMAQAQSTEEVMTVGLLEPFAFKAFGVGFFGAEGEPVSQAGSAPAEAASTIRFRTVASAVFPGTSPRERFKDTIVHVPPGVVGNPTSTAAKCTSTQLAEASPESESETVPNCPQDSQVGVAHVITPTELFGANIVPLYNMVPRRGAPAEFGLQFEGITIEIVARLRPSDNGVDLVALKAPSTTGVAEVDVDFWGVPEDPSHDYLRHLCAQQREGNFLGERCSTQAPRRPFLRTPTSCSGPLLWTAEVTSYEQPENVLHAQSTSPGMAGCEALPFAPTFGLAPAHLTPETPTGLDATVALPQEAGPDGLATADLRSAVVTLPAGVSLNPSSAAGLQACGDGELKLGVEGVATCPEASELGTVSLTTPLIDHPLSGSIFLRPQESMDPASGKLFRVAIEIRSDDDGVDIKLPAAIRVDPNTGQLTTVIEDAPQLPFSSFTLHFKDGPRAALATPTGCGTFTTTATFDSWSGKTVSTSSSFDVSGDGHGSSCAAPGFSPVIKAGTANPVANAFSPFTLQLTRSDSDQQLSSISPLRMPAGLLANIGSVPKCGDAQVAAASCPESSRLGNLTVGAGAGPDPFYVTDGNVYLTGPYRGAPFGLAFVVHAKAGPFDLGVVVVRAALRVDPVTAQAVVESDSFPRMLAGVPLRLRDIRVSVDRPNFMFNPTNCGEQSVTGTVNSIEGAQVGVADRFQVGDCSLLRFRPSFGASTDGSGRFNRGGASLDVRLGQAGGPGSGEANIRRVEVQLPRVLPARLTTLQKACTAAQFAANPAGCPEASFVGTAVAHTPILSGSLSGPAVLVSHGGEAFPDLVLLLQGEGIRLELTGHTQIKNGITYSRFETVPDAPVSSFELKLPEGPYSALAANGDLCEEQLVMPTAFRAQNGIETGQNTRIEVTGCPTSVFVRSKRVSKRTLKLSVYAPVAGKLSASGRGLSSVSRSYTGREVQTLTLTQKKGGKLKTTVRVAFTPRVGKDRKKQFKTVKVTFKK